MHRVLLLVSIVVCCLGGVSRQSIEAAFLKDNFKVSQWVKTENGEGCVALSLNATNWRTKLPKKAFYIRGSFYGFGQIMAQLASSDLEVVATQFLRRIPLSLLDPTWVASHNSTVVREIEALIERILIVDSQRAFDEEYNRGAIPPFLLQNMVGLAEEQKALNCSTAVTLDLLKALNYGFDVITARIFSGHVFSSLPLVARRALRPTSFCNGIAVRNSWLKPGVNATGYLGRDFQFSTAGILQDFLASVIYVPTDAGNYHSVMGVMAPGFVGLFAGQNDAGVAMGVNTIRSGNGNATHVGVNSLLMLRTVTSVANSFQHAVNVLSSLQRGAPFMYPTCDATGQCAVLEAGRSVQQHETPLSFVRPELIRRKLVPDEAFLSAHAFPASWQQEGVYVRHMNYTYPDEYVAQFNPKLFAFKKQSFNASSFTLGQFVYANFTLDNESRMENLFFMPQKETDPDLVVVSNFGVVPENRLMMMNQVDDFISRVTADALIWRYDMMLKILYEKKGQIDFDTMIWIMSFLSPNRTPGYWKERIDPTDPMSAIVEGSTSVFDLKNQVMSTLTGYFHDAWIKITLPNYL